MARIDAASEELLSLDARATPKCALLPPVFEKALAADPTDARAQFDLFVALENFVDIHQNSGDIPQALATNRRIVSILDALVRKQPANREWAISRAYHQYWLATLLARSGDLAQAHIVGAAALAQLNGFADSPEATPQILDLAAEANSLIEPTAERDPARAIR